MNAIIHNKSRVQGDITVPGDKSISHRAVILGAIADGITTIDGFLMGADCLNTINCLKELGVFIDVMGTHVEVHGVGINGLKPPTQTLYVGNSGTTIRLLTGILAAQPFVSRITGDESIKARPMLRVVKPLRYMGADISSYDGGNHAPLIIKGGPLHGITYEMPVASAQVKSALLLAGLYADSPTTVIEPYPSRDHTELMLKSMGGSLSAEDINFDRSRHITVYPSRSLKSGHIDVPGDISSAAFIITAALLCPDACITIRHVGINPTRTGIIDAYKAMGADIDIHSQGLWGTEMVADITVRSSQLYGITISGNMIPRLIDEIPVLAVAAAIAQGPTIIRDAQELRAKESDRIEAIRRMLHSFGAEIDVIDDGMVFKGNASLHGCIFNANGDHRMAMAAAVAGMIANGETIIEGAECVDVSFPGFFDLINSISL